MSVESKIDRPRLLSVTGSMLSNAADPDKVETSTVVPAKAVIDKERKAESSEEEEVVKRKRVAFETIDSQIPIIDSSEGTAPLKAVGPSTASSNSRSSHPEHLETKYKP